MWFTGKASFFDLSNVHQMLSIHSTRMGKADHPAHLLPFVRVFELHRFAILRNKLANFFVNDCARDLTKDID